MALHLDILGPSTHFFFCFFPPSPPCSDLFPHLMDFTTLSSFYISLALFILTSLCFLNNLTWLSENCEAGVVQPASLCALSRAEETCATATEH